MLRGLGKTNLKTSCVGVSGPVLQKLWDFWEEQLEEDVNKMGDLVSGEICVHLGVPLPGQPNPGLQSAPSQAAHRPPVYGFPVGVGVVLGRWPRQNWMNNLDEIVKNSF